MPNVKQADVDELVRLRSFEAAYLDWRDHVLRLLASEKFQGFDTIKVPCDVHYPYDWTAKCGMCRTREERKDWIAIADVQNLLRCLEDQRA
jgi:hypothetical protein